MSDDRTLDDELADDYCRPSRFAPVGPTSEKVQCVICGARGYDYEGPRSWKNAHKREHLPCPKCGKLLASWRNGKPRTHGTCPRICGGDQ
jgi:hypothetical protein